MPTVKPFDEAYPAPWHFSDCAQEIQDKDGCHVTAADLEDPAEREYWRGIVAAVNSHAAARGAGSVTITAPNGAIYHLSLEGDDLWVHLEAAPGQGARIDYEANAGNEGWLRLQQRPALRATMPVRRPRAAA